MTIRQADSFLRGSAFSLLRKVGPPERTSGCLLCKTVLYVRQCFSDIISNTDRLSFDFCRDTGFCQIDTYVSGIGILAGHLPKGIFNNSRRITADTQFQIYNIQVFMTAYKGLIPVGCHMPAVILQRYRLPVDSLTWAHRKPGNVEPTRTEYAYFPVR